METPGDASLFPLLSGTAGDRVISLELYFTVKESSYNS